MSQELDRLGLLGKELEGKFRIDRALAEGGFGVVYVAQHLALEVPIAIKVLKTPPEMSQSAREAFCANFLREAKTIARMKHPNIVQVLDTGVSTMPSGERAPWMALEFLSGQTLHELLRARARIGFPPREAFELIRPIFDALAYAHEMKIAHRDIKPGNIMVVTSRRRQTPYLLDFGIAKLMDHTEPAGSGHTRTTSTMNAFSLQYAAPEQVSAARTGPWTDVHAMGLVLTSMLTGRAPYAGREAMDLMREVLSERRPTPAKFGVDVGPLEAVLQRALAYRPDERFPDCTEFLAALDALSEFAEPTMIAGSVSARGASPATPGPTAPAASTPSNGAGASLPGGVGTGARDGAPAATEAPFSAHGASSSSAGHTTISGSAVPVSKQVGHASAHRWRGVAAAVASAATIAVAGGIALWRARTQHAASQDGPTSPVATSEQSRAVTRTSVPTTQGAAAGPPRATEPGVAVEQGPSDVSPIADDATAVAAHGAIARTGGPGGSHHGANGHAGGHNGGGNGGSAAGTGEVY